MPTKEKSAPKRNRIYWMDNLRSIIIFLVVLYHIGGVYEAAGLWVPFWIVVDPDTISWVGIVGVMFDTFMMPTLFLISGYLTLAAFQKKTGWQFIWGKFKRLMIPWLVAVFTLIPLYKVTYHDEQALLFFSFVFFSSRHQSEYFRYSPYGRSFIWKYY